MPATPTSLPTRSLRRRGSARFRKNRLSANRPQNKRRSRLPAKRHVVLLGPFGEPLTTPAGVAAEMPFRFSTKYQDAETGLYSYIFRPYDPITGRWLSRDPIGEVGGLNLYECVGNDPVNSVDPIGHDRWIMGDYHPAIYLNQYDSAGNKEKCFTRIEFGADVGSGRNAAQVTLYVGLKYALRNAGARGAHGAALSLAVLKGAIYVTPNQDLPIHDGRIIQSDKAQDKLFLDFVTDLKKDLTQYNTLFFNCRHFVNQIANYPMQDIPEPSLDPVGPLIMPGSYVTPVWQVGHWVMFQDNSGNSYRVWSTRPVQSNQNHLPR